MLYSINFFHENWILLNQITKFIIKIAYNNIMFWIIIIRIQKINIFHEDSNKSQESAIFHDYKVIDTSTNMMSWILVTIWLQNHISIWQARSEVWCVNTTITKFAHECRWQTNHELISDSVISETIWKNTTCFHRSWTQ